MKKDIKPIPDFNNEDEERDFWATHSAVDYFDVSNAYRPTEPFHHLKPTEDLLALKIPSHEVENLNSLAKEHHVSRDVLAMRYVLEGIRRERGREPGHLRP
jgi:hypothetical protein